MSREGHGYRELRRLIDSLEAAPAVDLDAFAALPFKVMLQVVWKSFKRKLWARTLGRGR